MNIKMRDTLALWTWRLGFSWWAILLIWTVYCPFKLVHQTWKPECGVTSYTIVFMCAIATSVIWNGNFDAGGPYEG
jgi:hypothetical protein